MGNFLTEPITTKEFEELTSPRYQALAGSMQGWRVTMEDAHILCKESGDDPAVFGVFDGHGGIFYCLH